MAKEATYLVLAPTGITSGAGLHPAGSIVGESDLGGEGARLQSYGLVVRTANDAEPVHRKSYPGVPGWNDVAAAVAVAPAPPAPGEQLPEHAPQNAADYVPPAVTAEQLAAAAAPTDLHPDADATAVVAQPAPAVLRFVEAHPARLQDVLAAEQHGKNRVTVVEALRDKAATFKTGQHRPMPEKPPAGVKKTAAKRTAARTRKG